MTDAELGQRLRELVQALIAAPKPEVTVVTLTFDTPKPKAK